MGPYASVNKGYKFLLTVIDIFSKYAWAITVKSKTGKDIAAAIETILKDGNVLKNLHVDNGRILQSRIPGINEKIQYKYVFNV